MTGNYSDLSGRDILRKLNWEEVFKYDNRDETVKFVDEINLNNVLSRYKSVFDKKLGTLKNAEVTFKVKSDAIPKFCMHLKIELKKNFNVLLQKDTRTYFSF